MDWVANVSFFQAAVNERGGFSFCPPSPWPSLPVVSPGPFCFFAGFLTSCDLILLEKMLAKPCFSHFFVQSPSPLGAIRVMLSHPPSRDGPSFFRKQSWPHKLRFHPKRFPATMVPAACSPPLFFPVWSPVTNPQCESEHSVFPSCGTNFFLSHFLWSLLRCNRSPPTHFPRLQIR